MTLGEIKIEALKLMCGELTGEDATDFEKLRGETFYRELLDKMPGSINRCISELEGRGVLPSVSVELSEDYMKPAGAFFVRVDLNSIAGLVELERVVRVSAVGEYNGNYPYSREGRSIVLPKPADGDVYSLLYKSGLGRVSNYTDNETVLTLPEHIAAIIPYYIKGELFREDEPSEAAEARNLFEQMLASFAEPLEGSQGAVETVYSVRY